MSTKKIILSVAQIDEIWNYYKQGYNRTTIASEMGISEWAVRKEIQGKCRVPGQSLRLYHKNNTIPLSYEQKQLILGSLLGDASLSYREDHDTFDFQVGHCLEQRIYLEYKARVLNTQICSYIKDEGSYSAGKEFFKTYYSNKYELEQIYDVCFRNGVKTVTKEWVNALNAMGIAIWFMDDGTSTISNKNVMVRLSTLSFPKSQVKLLQRRLIDFAINSTLQKHTDGYGYVIYIRQNSINRFMDLVEPYIIDCMQYKIKRRIYEPNR